MKKLLFLLWLLPFVVSAQTAEKFEGRFEVDCNRYLLERLVARDTMFGNIGAELLGPKVTTLFIQKTSLTEKLPDSMGGYQLRYIDFEEKEQVKAAYAQLKDSTASLFYMGNPQSRYAYQDIYVMPMYLVKKGRHYKPEYTGKGCKCTFYMDYSKSTYGYDRSTRF